MLIAPSTMLLGWSRTYLEKCSRFWGAERWLARACMSPRASTPCLMRKAMIALREGEKETKAEALGPHV